MKTTEAGKLQQKQIREALVTSAMKELWANVPITMANTPAQRVRTTLATRVKRVRRGDVITYTLIIPEINRTYTRQVPAATEVALKPSKTFGDFATSIRVTSASETLPSL